MPEKNIELKKGDEFRAYDFEIRANNNDEHGHFLEGVPIVFGQRTDMGWYDEIIEPGALDKADMKDVRFLVNHNTDMIPLARSRNNNENSTMQMQILEDGLHIRVDLDIENNSEAKNLYSAVERGDVSGMSFMFRVNGDKWDDIDSDHPTRHITDMAKIFEVSAVTWPAYDATSISARCAGALDNAKEELESLRKAQNDTKEAEIRQKQIEAENEARKRNLDLLANS